MKVTDLKWRTESEGEVWTLSGFISGSNNKWVRRKLFDLMYLGRTQVAFGGRHDRYRVIDRRYWVDNPQDIPEFLDLDEAKAWVDAVVRLDP
jgi:hypothetical protein